ncbi:MAG: hypothetical protein A2Z68_00395 [Candidatus Nealsonbacteria bacterium RBG_13_38_11]|uniref:Uncharacterized protein n=1 Tax=Candidatus Nealsonbacteria bacterium RBG_13_38_11 TaxID=1801662 RepID=A0A1G2DYW8_9BACT|nr:MAG: hypothetical protein A2Z68_00395 [Candidatus Nealsonbacteria bacterium RBG_13_38_11]HXK32366.1 hypothetical protein [Candidatus Paceibacterota bacterium]
MFNPETNLPKINSEKEREPIKDPVLYDFYISADNANLYSVGGIKRLAERMSLKLHELGVADFPSESKLAEAYRIASKIKENGQNVSEARLAMGEIASLIHESDGFKDSSNKWFEEKNKKNSEERT